MAKSKQGTGKTAKRASASRSSGGKSRASQNRSGARASGSASRKTSSGRAQRRAQASNLGSSVALAGVGLLVIALVLVRGEGGWLMLRNVLFGIFGIVTYLVGPFLLYLAYLVASGYRVSIFVAKMTLLTLMAASVPVVFSRFAVHESTAWDIIKMLYSWGQTRFWAGGVFGGIGAVLLALCGRPGANIIMLLLFAMGLMVFFALTPADVVQFLRTGADRWQTARREREAERTAYDTQLFGQQPEEEPIENLTGSLPEPPRPARHPAFDVAPYLEEQEKGRGASRAPAQQAPAQAAPAVPAAHRSDFDVDLGPDASTRALENAVHNDPLERIEIGPGGTFGLDPLAQLSRKKKAAAQPAPVPAENTGDFELRLEPEPETEPEVEDAADELDALIGRAMSNVPAQAPLTPAQEVSSEIRLDYPLPEEEPFATTLEPVPQQEPPAPQPAPIPTLGGSFDEEDGFDEFDEDEEDAAAAAWKAGVPVSDLLTGRYQPQAAPAAPASPAAAPVAGRLRVSTSVGNSASAPVSSPPAAAKATPEAQALAAASREPAAPYCYPSLNLFNANRPEDEAGAVREMKHNADVLVNTLDSFGVKTKILDICRGPSVTRYELQPQAGIKVGRRYRPQPRHGGRAHRSADPRQTRCRHRGAQQDPRHRQHPQRVRGPELHQHAQPAHHGAGQGYCRAGPGGRFVQDAAPAHRRFHRQR